MIAHDLYQRLMTNLEIATKPCKKVPTALTASLHAIGAFLSSRSTQFDVLEKQDNAAVFLSLCRSNRENLVLVFNYFLTDRPFRYDTKKSSSQFLKTLLDDFDKAINILKKNLNQEKLQLAPGKNNIDLLLRTNAPGTSLRTFA